MEATAAHDLTIHGAQLGLAWYTFNGLLHPDSDGRAVAREWWKRAAATAAEVGARAVDGPLGAMSVADAADPARREERYARLLEDVVGACEAARAAGLESLLVEPTPLPREIPSTVEQSRRLVADLVGKTAVPVRSVVDVGHALYRPLYGDDVSPGAWPRPLADSIGVLHLQNHDYRSDAHLGWPDERGAYDVAAFAREVRAAGVERVPVVPELFYPFEAADDDGLVSVRSSVRHCLAALGDTAA